MAARTRQGSRTITKSPETLTPAQQQWRAAERETEAASLELPVWRWFLAMNAEGYIAELPRCQWNGGQPRIIPGRQFRYDFTLYVARAVIDLDGAMWGRRNPQTLAWEQGKRGGHVSASGYENNRHKDALAMLDGWRILRLTPGMLRDGSAFAYIERMLGVTREPKVTPIRQAPTARRRAA